MNFIHSCKFQEIATTFFVIELPNWKKTHLVQHSCCRFVMVITTAQLHSTKPELSFCAGPNSARGVLKICDGKNL